MSVREAVRSHLVVAMTFGELMERGPGEITFSGLGPYEVFSVPGKRYVGTVIMRVGQPPFVHCDEVATGCYYAPNHRFFARGVVRWCRKCRGTVVFKYRDGGGWELECGECGWREGNRE